MSSPHERNDRKKGFKPRLDRGPNAPRGKAAHGDGKDWLWGVHAVEAALANPKRGEPRRLVATADRAKKLSGHKNLEILEAQEIARYLPQGAVHQGLAMKPEPLEGSDIDAIGSPAKGVLVMLDQITDPQNVGAIFRSAAAFGAKGIILQDRNAPPLTGALAKAAAGAVDQIDHASVVNLSRALERLSELGWKVVGLDGAADTDLADALEGSATVLVLGSEGEGIRRLVAEHCDILARIPMPGGFESLNVSNAAAIALYEASRPGIGRKS
ncbi:23S rRNA (guanosine(2251)-2'-O)-methyltransferase RlmB [Caulobacter ginsengisoli]|uniref:23S rRNA (guanosine(2251)-2'-O)-methyltransferase RlmB n=1 Tax=Caulobacter ginsengisoli TaxID=400775 RepID=UPI003520EE39